MLVGADAGVPGVHGFPEPAVEPTQRAATSHVGKHERAPAEIEDTKERPSGRPPRAPKKRLVEVRPAAGSQALADPLKDPTQLVVTQMVQQRVHKDRIVLPVP